MTNEELPDVATPGLSGETAILVAIARLDGKVTGALGAIENLRTTDNDHETRLRKLEEKRYITPGQLWAGLVGVASVCGVAATVYALLPH